MFGYDYKALKRALEGLRMALQFALDPGGEFAGCSRGVWHPWHGDGSQALSVHRGGGWWADIPAPGKLAGMTGCVFAATG